MVRIRYPKPDPMGMRANLHNILGPIDHKWEALDTLDHVIARIMRKAGHTPGAMVPKYKKSPKHHWRRKA